MANPRALLKRRKAVQNTRKLTKTMELVATARLSKAQHAALAARPYAQRLQQVIADLARVSSETPHPLLQVHSPAQRAWVLLLTSDRGLCCAFNANLFREFRRLRGELLRRGLELQLLVQGKKGLAFCKYQGWPVAQSFLMVSEKPSYQRAEELGGALIAGYTRREVDEAYVVHSAFRSSVSQAPRTLNLLPLSELTGSPAKDNRGGISGNRGAAGGAFALTGYLYHPGPRELLAEVLPLAVKTSLFAAMLESCAAEQAARRVAMKNATDASDKMITMLTRSYNRARQGKITQEIGEIVGGAEAL